MPSIMSKENNSKTVQGFFDLKEAAAFAKCSVATIKNHIKAGRLKGFQAGGVRGTIIVPQGNLIDFITSHPYGQKKNAPRS